jgi:hypothetical protein
MLQTPFALKSGGPPEGEPVYGLGWRIGQVSVRGASTKAVFHGGDFVVGSTALLMDVPAHDLSIALATNVSFAHIGELADMLADLFGGDAP